LTIEKNNNSFIDLLLINPPNMDHSPINLFSLFLHKLVNYFPPGLLYLAANVKRNGYKVKIYDMELNYNIKKLLKFIKSEKPKIIGITALSFSYLNALKTLRIIKNRFPKVVTIIGGIHISKNPTDAIKRNYVDYELLGEADFTLVELLNYVLKKKGKINDIEGLVYINHEKIIQNPGFPIVEELNSLPYPALELLDNKRYYISFQKYHPSSIIMGSRGCPFQCIFCDKLTNKLRLRTPENIISEIKFMYRNYKIRDFQFYDLTFNADRNWVKDICSKLIEENLPIAWRCTSRVELMDDQLVKLMKKAGCYLIALGVESGNNNSLKFLKKGFKVKDIIKAFKLTKKYNLETHAYYIVGIPGEDKKAFLKTIKLIKSIAPDYINSLTLRPYPHTELAKISKEKGWFDFSNINFLKPDFKYQNKLTLLFDEMSPEEIIKMQRYGFISYYLNINYILRIIFKLVKEPRRFFFNIWKIFIELLKKF